MAAPVAAAPTVSRPQPASANEHRDEGNEGLSFEPPFHPAIVSPPETEITWPVMNAASSEARKGNDARNVSGLAHPLHRNRPHQRVVDLLVPASPSPRKPRRIGVSVGPGHTTFTVTPCRASSRASVFENATIPPLHAA
jgi:hypothetical protein